MTHDQASPSAHFPANKLAAGSLGVPLDSADATPATATAEATPVTRSRAKSMDEQLVDETKNQIRALVQEIADLAKTDCTTEEFYEGFLTRTTNALASIGGAIWIRGEDQTTLQLQYHINLKKTGLVGDNDAQTKHHKLLERLAERGEPVLVRPDSESTSGSELSGNPTDFLLVVGPLTIDNQVIGLVEIFQRPGAGPTTQRGYQRFLLQMCEIANEYLSNEKIRTFAKQQQIWQQLEQFIRLVHQGLDTNQTVFTLANEARRLIDCDRVSVATGDRRRCQIKTVSGLDSIERRAEQVKKLGALASAVVRTGQPLWYNGESDQLPPQIENKLQDYVDQSHTKMLAILPLTDRPLDDDTTSSTDLTKPGAPIGALIVEQLTDSRITPALRQRVDVVVEHGQTALANSREHNSIFLMPLWKALGKATSLFRAGKRAKTFAVAVAIGAAIAFMSLFQYEFGLAANGRLTPESQYEVFAQSNGRMEDVFVSDTGDTLVRQGQILGQMSNSDIELTIAKLNGRIAEARSQIESAKQQLSTLDLDALDSFELSRQRSQDEQLIASLSRELEIRQQEKEMLSVISPADGRVINWNARQNLLRRPIELGQQLMTIVPPGTTWQLELQMPERRLNHLFEASEQSDEPLRITFGLVSNPGIEYVGTLISVDRKLDVYSDDGNAALVRVAFDNEQIDTALLRSETRVTAKVHCGSRSIGYVMFHELIETVQSKLMFWF